MKLFLAPHNDDEALFGAYTLLREKPLVVICTDGYIQAQNGHNITWSERRNESRLACGELGCEVRFLGIPDTELTDDRLEESLYELALEDVEVVYAPALQGGNHQHDLVHRVATKLFDDVIYYATYTKDNLVPFGSVEIKPTEEEREIKVRVLEYYESQHDINWPHFEAVMNKSEYYV